jgi:hypothetical protein
MEYLKDLNGNQAAIRAGHSMRSAYSTAERTGKLVSPARLRCSIRSPSTWACFVNRLEHSGPGGAPMAVSITYYGEKPKD